MAYPPPPRQFNGPPNNYDDPYGPPRGSSSRQGNYRDPPPQQQRAYDDYPPPRPPNPDYDYNRPSSRSGGRRPPPPQGRDPRDAEYYDRGYRPGMYAPAPPGSSQGPRKPRPPVQALDLASGPPDRSGRRRPPPGAEDYTALVSPIYDKRFEGQIPISPPRGGARPSTASRGNEGMPSMQFGQPPPPRTKSAPPDDPRNWDRNGPPPPSRGGYPRDGYSDRGMGNGRGPAPRGGRPPPPRDGGYDKRSPNRDRGGGPGRYPDGRGPPPRSNTFPVPPNDYDYRGPPPSRGGYPDSRGPPPSRGMEYDRRMDDRYDGRGPPPPKGGVDDLLDDYLEELGSPDTEHAKPDYRNDARNPGPPRGFDPRANGPRSDSRMGGDYRPDPRDREFRGQPSDQGGYPPQPRRSPPFSDTGAQTDSYTPPDRRQLTANMTPSNSQNFQRSNTLPEITSSFSNMDLQQPRRDSPPDLNHRRSPNKLQKSPSKQPGPLGAQPQIITTANGQNINPNALPTFPEPDRPPSKNPEQLQNTRTSVSSQGTGSRIPLGQIKEKPPPKPKLTFALLEEYRRDAKENPSDPAIQLELAKALCEAGTLLSNEQGMGDPKRVLKSRENYWAESLKLVKKLASSGSTGVGKPPYPDAMFFLATCYSEGDLGLPQDHEKAFNLYFSAAKAGHQISCYRTAMSCEVGIGTKRDPQKAMQFYRKAASLGDVAAMYKLGIIMLRGLLGLPPNTREAITWLKRAAENADEENPQALNVLAKLYEKPDEAVNGAIIQDEAYALELYHKGAHLNYPPCQYKLGVCYEYGSLGCVVDPRKSIAWYSRAAEQGDAEASLALSGWYLTGAEGILPQSDQEAFLWAQKAAEQGLAKAEFAVGYYTETGIGTNKDLAEAKKWYLRAAEQGQKRAMARLAELKKGPSSAQGGAGGGKKELQKHRGGGGKEDCLIM